MSRISEGWYQHLRIQETWDQQAALQLPLVTDKMPNALPRNSELMLGVRCSDIPTSCSPRMLQQRVWDQGKDGTMRLLWVCFPSPRASKALYHGQAALWPPNSELISSPGWCQDEKQRLEDQMESLHLPPHSAGVFCMYKQREIWGMLPGQTGTANKTTQ